jgi:PAS domain-containing protein
MSQLSSVKLSEEWTHDITEALTDHFGKSKDYGMLYDLIKQVVDKCVNISFESFREILGYHNDDYHGRFEGEHEDDERDEQYVNPWWPTIAYLLGEEDIIDMDGVSEIFVYEVIGIMDMILERRQESN